MKTENIMPMVGAFTIGVILTVATFAIIFVPKYNKKVQEIKYADAVIDRCINQYNDFYDTVAEGDEWFYYVESKYEY